MDKASNTAWQLLDVYQGDNSRLELVESAVNPHKTSPQ